MKKKNVNLKEIYNTVHSNEEKFFTYPPIIESIEIFKELDSWEGLTVLEIGCGVGDLAAMIASSGAKSVVACDYSESSINKAKSTYGDLENLSFICEDVNSMNDLGTFDIVVMQGVLEHFDKPFVTLDHIIDNFLSEEGTLINSCPAFYNPRGYVWMTLSLLFDVPMSLTDLHFLDIEDFKKYCTNNNLDIEWRSIHHDWASGDGLINDFQKRLVNALRDAKLPNDNVGKLLKWLKESSAYFVKTDDTGAEVIYKLRRR